VAGVPSLRKQTIFAAVADALRAGAARFGMRVVYYSVQSNHIHLIVEADDQTALSRGMRGLTIRIARAINQALRRKGKVCADHYYARELHTPAEVRRAVRYVLDNAMLHAGGDPQTDPCASVEPLVAPQTWLLRIGWLRSQAGPLPVNAWDAPTAQPDDSPTR
jgi:putative transposase